MNTLLFFDTETSDVDPNTCHVLQLAACVVDAEDDDLTIMDNGIFTSYIRPPLTDEEIMNPEIIKDGALNKNHIKREDILKFPEEKVVWKNFEKFCLSFRRGGELPVACGWNIKDFDLPIIERINRRNKCKKYFHEHNFIDLMNLDWIFCQRDPNYPGKSFDMAKIRYGIQMEGDDVGHEAGSDVKYGVMIMRRMLRMMWRIAKKNNWFRDSFRKEED